MSLLIEADSSLPLVQIAVSRLSGASSDPEGKEGLARLVTRLMRRNFMRHAGDCGLTQAPMQAMASVAR